MAQRRERTGHFKAKLVLEALKGHKTINEIASRYGVHPVQITQWKKQVLEELPAVFADRRGRAMREAEDEKARLYEQIGRLKVELDWLKKKLGRVQ
jgi:transposase-like protein